MSSYRYLEHRSDLLIEGVGSTLPAAIESVAQGLFNSISSSGEVSALFPHVIHHNPITVKFTETGIDNQDLIINIFTRVLAEMDAQSKIGTFLKVLSFDEKSHTATVEVGLCDGNAKLHVKAVTFHEFCILQSSDGTTLRVLFDI